VRLVLGNQANATDVALKCNRAASRQARYILNQFVFSHLGGLSAQLPDGCPLAPHLDVLLDHEQHKRRKSRGQHQCTYCNKIFRTEDYLDQHMQRKHLHLVPAAAAVCLADFCGTLHCEAVSSLLHSQKELLAGGPCTPQHARQERQRCEALAASCFPQDHGKEWQNVYRYFVSHFCAAHTCDLPQRMRLLQQLARAHRSSSTTTLTILILCLLAMFYAAFLVYLRFSKPNASSSMTYRQAASRAPWPQAHRTHPPAVHPHVHNHHAHGQHRNQNRNQRSQRHQHAEQTHTKSGGDTSSSPYAGPPPTLRARSYRQPADVAAAPDPKPAAAGSGYPGAGPPGAGEGAAPGQPPRPYIPAGARFAGSGSFSGRSTGQRDG